jgi:CHAT domain
MGRQSKTAAGNSAVKSSSATEYEDFVVVAKRTNARTIGIHVEASPAGRMANQILVAFSSREADGLRASFFSGPGTSGRMMITMDEAAVIGKGLAQVLFPDPVFRLFAKSLGMVARRRGGGLRIRLEMDESLADLPWEYVQRPDLRKAGAMSGFLLLDSSISMVRQRADPEIVVEPADGRQIMSFVGTLWEDHQDHFKVRKEFDLLREALKPIARYIEPRFAVATQTAAFKPRQHDGAAIFHYAGHCDFDDDGRAYLLREMPMTVPLEPDDKVYVDVLAPALAGAGTRLVVMSACNSGFWSAVKPLLDAGIPAVLGVNGAVANESTIEFCAKLYESLAVGLTLDDAVVRARLHIMEWGGRNHGLFDWGLYMVYMPSQKSTLFPREATRAVKTRQNAVREDHASTVGSTLRLAKELDGMNFGEIMSELSKRRVLILGRFTGRRLKILEAIKTHLQEHPNQYIPELFTFRKPESRDLIESIIGFAALSRFIIADLSEPKSVQSELEAIVPNFQSVPVVPLINSTGKEYATFSSVQRRVNVVKPTVRYRNSDDLLHKIDQQVVQLAEKKLSEIQLEAAA